jgi:HK97 family phage prohead protease
MKDNTKALGTRGREANIEKRSFKAVEVRMTDMITSDDVDSTGRRIEGYAFLHNSRTDMGWYNEIILPGAADGLLQTSDVRALLNHDPNQLLARSKRGAGTLSLSLDERGLKFSFECPQTRGDIIEMMERGDLDQCSFSFTIDEQRWIESDGEPELREIVKFKEPCIRGHDSSTQITRGCQRRGGYRPWIQ